MVNSIRWPCPKFQGHFVDLITTRATMACSWYSYLVLGWCVSVKLSIQWTCWAFVLLDSENDLVARVNDLLPAWILLHFVKQIFYKSGPQCIQESSIGAFSQQMCLSFFSQFLMKLSNWGLLDELVSRLMHTIGLGHKREEDYINRGLIWFYPFTNEGDLFIDQQPISTLNFKGLVYFRL